MFFNAMIHSVCCMLAIMSCGLRRRCKCMRRCRHSSLGTRAAQFSAVWIHGIDFRRYEWTHGLRAAAAECRCRQKCHGKCACPAIGRFCSRVCAIVLNSLSGLILVAEALFFILPSFFFEFCCLFFCCFSSCMLSFLTNYACILFGSFHFEFILFALRMHFPVFLDSRDFHLQLVFKIDIVCLILPLRFLKFFSVFAFAYISFIVLVCFSSRFRW